MKRWILSRIFLTVSYTVRRYFHLWIYRRAFIKNPYIYKVFVALVYFHYWIQSVFLTKVITPTPKTRGKFNYTHLHPPSKRMPKSVIYMALTKRFSFEASQKCGCKSSQKRNPTFPSKTINKEPYMSGNDLYLEQYNLEKKYREMTLTARMQTVQENIQKGGESRNYYGVYALKHGIDPFIREIEETIQNAKTGKAGDHQTAVKLLRSFEPKVIAYITIRAIIDKLTHKKNTLTAVSTNIGDQLQDELRNQAFEEAHPNLFKKIINETKTDNRVHKRKVLLAAYNRYCDTWSNWDANDKCHVGRLLVELFIRTKTADGKFLNYIEKNKRRLGRTKHVWYVDATQSFLDFIKNNKEIAALLKPMYPPMIVKPAPWESTKGGGYLSHHLPPLKVIKANKRPYLEDLDNRRSELTDVYGALNTVQETPWQVNGFVLKIFKECWDRKLQIAKLPSQHEYPYPPKLSFMGNRKSSDFNPEEYIEFCAWKQRVKKWNEDELKRKSKVLMDFNLKKLAEEFSVYPRFYYPHTMDFRGRMYPASMYLNPQQSSLAKGLLKFADGKPLGEHGGANLCISLANEFGYDKVSYNDRIQWVYDNQERIINIAKDPMSDLWWANDAQNPWTTLALCEEVAGYLSQGDDYISYLPCNVDATCSGLQHWVAALKQGGEMASAVNLTPRETPGDVYQVVADACIKSLEAEVDSEPLAQIFLDYGIDRSSVKRSTMTLPYGSTLYSARDFIEEWIANTDEKRFRADPEYRSVFLPHDGMSASEQDKVKELRFSATLYLAKHVWNANKSTIVAATEGMKWLQETARILAKENLPIEWTTLDGLPVQQAYLDTRKRKVKTRDGQSLIYLTLQEPIPNKLNSRRQANGISPNWIHSMDACHARMTVNLATSQPKNPVTHLSMIHDSFGTHACDVPLLSRCIRLTFVEIYGDNNPIQMFIDDRPISFEGELPPPPPMGNLDINEVENSDFFFS